jgi:hypothetical protein
MRKVILGLAIAMLACGPVSRVSAETAGDRAIAQQIAQNMKESGHLKDYRVGVKYQNGVAWLMGSVTSAEQKDIAEQIARESEGVERVICKLDVKGGVPDDSVQPAGGPPSGRNFQTASNSVPQMQRVAQGAPRGNAGAPLPYARTMGPNVQPAGYCPPGGQPGMEMGMGGPGGMGPGGMGMGGPMGAGPVPAAAGQAVNYENPQMPGYAWPSYAAYPNYAALTYPKQYSAAAWPYIGPFYPYPQVPLGWRKVTLEWDDGWWMLDFKDCKDCH